MIREIEPNLLWIGNISDASNHHKLFEYEIRLLLELAIEEAPVIHPRDFLICRIPLLDGSGNDPAALELLFLILSQALRSNIKTFIYCSAGMSRSPAVALAALAQHHQLKIHEALIKYQFLISCDIQPGLLCELEQSKAAWLGSGHLNNS